MSPVLLVLFACNSRVKQDFQATYAEFTAPPPPLESPWYPDASIRISPAVLESAIGAALTGADLSTYIDLPGARIEPSLIIDHLRVADPEVPCRGCLGLAGMMSGNISYNAFGYAGRTSVKVYMAIDTTLEARQEADGWVILASVPKVHRVRTEVPMLSTRVADLVISPIISWLTGGLTNAIGPIRVARLGEIEAPLQAVSVAVQDGILEILARTTASHRAGVAQAPDPGTGWSVRLASESVIGLARKAAFENGSLGLGLWAEPRDLSFEDDTFTLGLRIWRVSGMGWWRDYHIVGDLGWSESEISLSAHEVTEVAQSGGAGLADPIALMLEAKILDGLEKAVSASIPSSRTEDIGAVRTSWSLASLRREDDALVITGDAHFNADGR